MSIRRPDEDLFEDTRMSFGEHLDELRRALVKALIGVAIACLIGFKFANPIINYLQVPLNAAMEKYQVERAKRDLEKHTGAVVPELDDLASQRGVAPRSILIDPGQLVAAMRSASPSELGQVDLKPYEFSADDIRDDGAAAICRRWRDPDDAVAGKLAAAWRLLDPATQQQVTAWASETVAEPPSRDDVAQVLNELLDKPALHQSPELADWLSPAPQSILSWFSRDPPNSLVRIKQQVDEGGDPDLSRRLNRSIVWRLFVPQLNAPYTKLVPIEVWEYVDTQLQSLQPHEPFLIWMKAGIFAGLVISSPWVFYQIWSFVAAGLYRHEKRLVQWYLPISILLFLAGVAIAFFLVLEPVLTFLFGFNASLGITPQPRLGDWLGFVLFLPLGFGLAFQLPIVMLFLNRIGLVSVQAYLDKWRVAVLLIAFASMILTPADPVSMLLMLVPLVVLYFGGIAMCRWMPRTTARAGRTYEPGEA